MYKHILVAVELSDESDSLIDKAAVYAKKFNADVSLIYIDSTHGEIYTEFFDMNLSESKSNVSEKTNRYFERFISRSEVPIKVALVGTGNISNKLPDVIEKHEIDLLICGHHHDFWSHFISTSRQLINTSLVDILVHPIVEKKGE
ncbi:universal stress protein [Vibrio sp. VB16]|uniref:universal stress protein n=1 Tax=Vibrio sp. VB16 TaxID=2785746 RepID=UPI00189FD0A3|nr:universal stress protein [Vibrio sp. VB16]UGA53608.1 universal stress protein [Vibrio sp. VB16]